MGWKWIGVTMGVQGPGNREIGDILLGGVGGFGCGGGRGEPFHGGWGYLRGSRTDKYKLCCRKCKKNVVENLYEVQLEL